MFMLVFIFPVAAFADELVLVKGKGVEVCEAYKKNLNSFDLHNKYVMACERKINPEFAEFKTPEWGKMDLWENRKILEKIARFLGERSPIGSEKIGNELQYIYGDFQEWEDQLRNMMEGTYAPTVEELQIDIDNDGKMENVIKYIIGNGNCPGGNFFSASLIVLNNDKSEVDIEKTKPLFRNPYRSENQPLSAGKEFTMYDVFLYRNKAYFDRWDGHWCLRPEVCIKLGIKDEREILKVFVTETDKKGKVSTKEICRYRFKSMK
jgi:hypothetical protein